MQRICNKGLACPAGKSEAPQLEARTKLEGHTATVEDVVFRPGTDYELASVGDDRQVGFGKL